MRTLQSRTITVPSGVQLAYAESGDQAGLPLILLHGTTDSLHSFGPLMEQLPHSLRAIALSQRGHGDSAKPMGCYGMAEMAEDAVAVLDQLGIRRAVVLGHSMGSIVAMRLAADHAERVMGLVLIGAMRTLKNNPAGTELWRAIARMEDSVDPDFVQAFQESTVTRPVPAHFMALAIAESLKVPVHVWRSAFRSMLDYADCPERIEAAGLLIWGDRDGIVTRDEQQAIAASLAHAELVVHEGGGHAPHWEDPRGVAAEIAAWTKQLTAHAA